MGLYINPTDGSTEESWLEKHAQRWYHAPSFDELPPDSLPVCLVNNRIFTAAGICYSPEEQWAFDNPHDHRPRQWFVASIVDLLEVEPLLSH